MFYELYHKHLGYTHTATLENGVTITCYEDGTAEGSDGRKYRVVTHLDEEEDVVVDGWEPIEE